MKLPPGDKMLHPPNFVVSFALVFPFFPRKVNNIHRIRSLTGPSTLITLRDVYSRALAQRATADPLPLSLCQSLRFFLLPTRTHKLPDERGRAITASVERPGSADPVEFIDTDMTSRS